MEGGAGKVTERELLQSGLERLVPNYCPQAVDKLCGFSELLIEKNKVMNLTAITDPCEIVTRHFLDCAALASYIPDGARVLDVGTGAGFPGMPLAILTAGEFTLLDALRKRTDFLNDCIAALALPNAVAVHARAEDFAKEHRAGFDVATSRAVAELNVLCELALPMLKVGGVFYAMKAVDCDEEISRAKNAIRTLGGAPAEVIDYTVPHTNLTRRIVKIVKCEHTPEKYPRRFKKIESNPL